jgi:ACS family hexuronate transporter-like MFS transporter
MLVERKWTVLFLLFSSIMVNLVDRQTLSILAPVIRDEMHLSNSQYSFIIFFFLLGMAIFQVPVGILLDRRGARRGLPLLMLWWSIANALHAIARTVTQFSFFRFLLGAGECGNYSGGIKVISQWFEPQQRALAGGIFNSGTVIGAMVAPPIIVWIAKNYGWRSAFVLPSALGLLWIVPWLLLYRDRVAPGKAIAAPPLAPLFRMRQVWGMTLMRLLGGPVVTFYWYWLPEYLKRERHFSMEGIGRLAGIPFLFAGIGNIAGGWFSGLLMARGYSLDRARKITFLISTAMCFTSILVPLVPGELLPIAIISFASFGISTYVATQIGTLIDVFSPGVLARVTGITGVGEGIMNMTFTLATGVVVDRFGYLPVFIAAGVLPSLGVVSLFVLVRRIEPAA